MEKCPITDLPIKNASSNALTSYSIEYENEEYFLRFGFRVDALLNDEDFLANKHLVAGAILNNQLFDSKKSNEISLTLDNWKEKLAQAMFPKTPLEKLNNLLISLYKLQKTDGEEIKIHKTLSNPGFWHKHYFKTREECCFYVKTLHVQGEIDCVFQEGTGFPVLMQFSFQGLNTYLRLTESGNLSNNCFIAMSFHSAMNETRNAIKSIVINNGFNPILIDERNIESDKTINDAIIADIRNSKFCIADFTEQKDGVYFESGFAVGLGKPVIYTCRKDWFEKTHFDTNHFPHIIYEKLEELQDKLDKKIKAWIM